MRDDLKVSQITVSHWKNKFDKAIRVLLQSGIKAEDLIKEIKIIDENKNTNKN